MITRLEKNAFNENMRIVEHANGAVESVLDRPRPAQPRRDVVLARLAEIEAERLRLTAELATI